MDTLHTLLQYPAVHGVVFLAIACLALVVGVLVVAGGLHMLHTLGRRTILYKKRQPPSDWGKRFYPANAALILFIVVLMVWLRSLVP